MRPSLHKNYTLLIAPYFYSSPTRKRSFLRFCTSWIGISTGASSTAPNGPPLVLPCATQSSCCSPVYMYRTMIR